MLRATYPEIAEVCGTISDGAHNGGGLNGQDAYSGRILPVAFNIAPGAGDKKHDIYVTAADVAKTLDASGSNPAMHQGGAAVCERTSVRRLLPVECERLQGFPDEYTRIPWKNKSSSECPDGPRYKALGNSMAVPCMMWIGKQIQKALV